MEYHKNFSLEDLFYINDDGLVCCEEWKSVVGYDGLYMISDLGRFKSFQLNTIKIIKGWRDTYGYRTITLRENKILRPRTIHRMVAESFLNHKPNGTNEIVVDHKNHIRTDDRLVNLQLVTNRVNSSKDRKKGSSNFRGVTWNKNSERWVAQITVNNKRIGLGYFSKEEEASEYYQNALIAISKNEDIKIKNKTSYSRFAGVSIDRNNNRFIARITIDKKRKHIGTFVNEIDAHNAYQKYIKINKCKTSIV